MNKVNLLSNLSDDIGSNKKDGNRDEEEQQDKHHDQDNHCIFNLQQESKSSMKFRRIRYTTKLLKISFTFAKSELTLIYLFQL